MALAPELVHRRLRAASQNFRWSRAGRLPGFAGSSVSLFFLILFLFCDDTRFHVGAFVRWVGFLSVVAPLAAGAALAPSRRGCVRCRNWPSRGASKGRGARARATRWSTPCSSTSELRPGSALRAAVFEELERPVPARELERGVRPAAAGMRLGDRRWAWRRRWSSGGRLVRPAAFTSIRWPGCSCPPGPHRAADPHPARNASPPAMPA